MSQLTSTDLKYCAETLKETPESRLEAIETLKKWASENPHLNIDTAENSLVPFLRGCKYDLQRTKNKLKDYYTMRKEIPEWFSKRDPFVPVIQELVKLGVFIPLRQHLDNQLIVIIKTAVHNPSVHRQDDVFKAGNMILDLATKDDEMAQIYGIVAIFDMAGVGLAHGRQMTPSIIKKAVRSWQNYHCRPKRLEFVNAPGYINVVLSVFKSFMTHKLKGRIGVHYGSEGIKTVLPKEILPKDYGGDGENLNETISFWLEKLIESKQWFEENEKFKAE